MASKAQLQLQRVEEITQDMVECGEAAAVDTGTQSRAPDAGGAPGQEEAGGGEEDHHQPVAAGYAWLGYESWLFLPSPVPEDQQKSRLLKI